jgi:hypothetical protein
MENQNQENINQQFDQQFGQPGQQTPPFIPPLGPMELPNATAVLVLGILSIVGCFCYALPGVIMGIISLVLAGKATNLYTQNPGLYTESSYKNMKAGKVCGIIGLSLAIVGLIIFIIYVVILGAAFSAIPWATHMR